ncbi:MAG: tetratricopeptide repeat protein [Candidatus Krumholzibacteriia bacterium]
MTTPRQPAYPGFRAGVLLLMMVAIGGGCSGAPHSPGPAGGGGGDATTFAAPGLTWQDWAHRDWRIDRPQLVSVYLFKDFQPADPLGEYLEATRWRAERDSVGLAGFLDLDATERTERRRLARKHRDRALRLASLVDRIWDANRQGLWLPVGPMYPPPAGAGEAVTRAIGALNAACGLDPSDPAAWYDLAFLTQAVGDRRRALRAIDGALAALAFTGGFGEHPDGDRPNFRFWDPNRSSGDPDDPRGSLGVRLHLDRAWLEREAGDRTAARDALARADSLLAAGRGRTAWTTREARLLQGLMAADAGDLTQAHRIAGSIGRVPLWVRHRESWRLIRPLDTTVTLDKRGWGKRESALIGDWILARAHLTLGDCRTSLRLLGDPDPMIELPPGWARRFWNDIGDIHGACGRREDASLCFAMAAVYSPYFIWYPVVGARGSSQVAGRPGSGDIYFLSHEHFYVAGDLYSYAANTAVGYEVERDPARRRLLAAAAEDALTACRRRDRHGASALALRGRLRYFEARWDSALADLETAYGELRGQGQEDPRSALLIGLIRFNRGDYQGSVPWLQRSVDLLPQDAFGWRSLGLAQIFSGRADSALSIFDRAVELDGASHYGWYNRALLHLSRGESDPARRDLARAAALAPDDPDVAQLMNIVAKHGVTRVDLKAAPIEVRTTGQSLGPAERRPVRAVSLADELSGPGGGRSGGRGHPGADREGERLNLLGSDPERLVTELEAAHAQQRSARSRRNLAWAYLRTGSPREARRLLLRESVRDLLPDDLRLVLEADRQLGDTARARRLLDRLDVDPEPVPDARVWTMVATICLDQGWNEPARRALDVAIGLDPGNSALVGLRATLGGRSGTPADSVRAPAD